MSLQTKSKKQPSSEGEYVRHDKIQGPQFNQPMTFQTESTTTNHIPAHLLTAMQTDQEKLKYSVHQLMLEG